MKWGEPHVILWEDSEDRYWHSRGDFVLDDNDVVIPLNWHEIGWEDVDCLCSDGLARVSFRGLIPLFPDPEVYEMSFRNPQVDWRGINEWFNAYDDPYEPWFRWDQKSYGIVQSWLEGVNEF